MKTIILVRHGECLSNKGGFSYSDSSDDILTSIGQYQAKLTAIALEPLANMSWKLYTSTLTRAKQTADVICNHIDSTLPIISDSRLVEKDISESWELLRMRYYDFIDCISSEMISVIVTHGHVIQSVIADAMKVADPLDIEVTNCGISIISNKRVVSYNSILHLHKANYKQQV